MDTHRTIYNCNKTVTYWDVYTQQWHTAKATDIKKDKQLMYKIFTSEERRIIRRIAEAEQ